MKMNVAVFGLLLVCSSAFADPVVDAYDALMAAGKVAAQHGAACEASVQKDDVSPCRAFTKANDVYRGKIKAFLATIDPKTDNVYNHINKQDVEAYMEQNKRIERSMDYVIAHSESS
ncbi:MULTISPECIES: hypothetical protein [Pseudomonas]|uniref:Type VI secretion protein n=1 Tax=Pseudomonas moraviensis R28-S TaxID=1395516 RepID=V8R4J8_9PSED|nr:MULTISPECIES: hypothetical protein [Pseudomonas]ETF07021.1 hypothetical protein PMO01_17195 [Pseudomonas moraviensis R28-S]MBP5968730.1 hypothetical protein [Pseudomonas iridis]